MDHQSDIQNSFLTSLQDDSLYDRGRIEKIVESLALGTLFMISLLANGAIFTVLLRYKRQQKVSNVFLLSLVFANLLLSVLILPFVISTVIAGKWLFGWFWCEASGFIFAWVSTASNLSLVAIAIHRYFIVIKPLALKIDLQKANQIIVFLWFVALSCAVPPLFGWSSFVYSSSKGGCTLWWKSGALVYTMYYVTTAYVIPVLVISFVYRKIYVRTKRQRKLQMYVFSDGKYGLSPSSNAKRSVVEHSCCCLPSCGARIGEDFRIHSSILKSRGSLGRQVSRHSTVIQQRTFQSASAIVTSFVVCLTPYFVFNVWVAFEQPALPYGIVDFVTTLLYLCMTAINPMTYGYSDRHIRRAVRKLLLFRCCFEHGRDRTYQMDSRNTQKPLRSRRSLTFSQNNEALEIDHYR